MANISDGEIIKIDTALTYWARGQLSAKQVHGLLRKYGYKADLRRGIGGTMPVQTLDGKKEFDVEFKKGGVVMKTKTKAKKTIKKVAGKLQKASKAHAGQAKTLSAIKLKAGGSTVNKAGNYTKPTMRKRIFNRIKAGSKGGRPGQWSARKAQMLAKQYKAKGGGYK